jgi:hypothetical protein
MPSYSRYRRGRKRKKEESVWNLHNFECETMQKEIACLKNRLADFVLARASTFAIFNEFQHNDKRNRMARRGLSITH